MDKKYKKEMQRSFKEKQREALMKEIPISIEDFKFIISELSTTPCFHDHRNTERLLKEYPQKEPIIEWFCRHGGLCDCEIVANVVDDYYFLFEDAATDKQQDSLSEPVLQKIKQFKTQIGLGCEVPKPWQLFMQEDVPDQQLFCFGKKGQYSDFTALFYEFEPGIPAEQDAFFDEAWRKSNPQLEGEICITREILTTEIGEMQLVAVKSPLWTPVYIWAFVAHNPQWYIIAKTALSRMNGDIIELKKLLRAFKAF